MRLPFSATRRQVLGTVLVMTGSFVAAMDASVIGTAMPTVIGELGGIDRYAWVFSAYLLTSTATTPIFGRLADMYGRKPLYFGALVAFVSFSMLAGTSRTMDELIAYRALQGLGAGALLPIGITMVGDLYGPRSRAKVVGLFSSVWVIAAMIGPVIGATLTQTLSWRWTFYVNLPIGLIALAILILGFRDTGEHRRQRIDWVGSVVFVSGATLLMLGLSGVAPLATISISVVLGMLFLRVEERTDAPMIDLALLRDPFIGAALAITLAAGAVQFGVISFVPPFIQGVLGGQPAEAGFALAAVSIGWSGGATAAGWVLFRLGVRRVVLAGAIAMTAAILMFVLLGPGSALALVFVAGTVAGIGMGWTAMPLVVTLQTSVGYAQRASITSLVQFARTLGGAAGVAALGSVLTTRLGPHAADAAVLLDPLARRSADAAAIEGLSGELGDALRAVYIGMLALAVLVLVLARRLPREVPNTDEPGRVVRPAGAGADQPVPGHSAYERR